jgi:glutathione reductase (NADPH)
MTEEEATQLYGEDNIKVYRKKFTNLFFAPAEYKEPSFFKIVTLRKGGKVLGIHGLGKGIDEMLQGFAVCVKMGATIQDFEKTVHIYPTASEEFVTMDYHFKD